MRPILAASATVLALGVMTSTTALAQGAHNAAARASLNSSYNKCVSLARSPGYASSDISDNRTGARNFVVRCMQGKQH
jgi:hypothetical protein